MIQRPNVEKIAIDAKQLHAGGQPSDDINKLAHWAVQSIATLVEHIDQLEGMIPDLVDELNWKAWEQRVLAIKALGAIGYTDEQICRYFARQR